MTDIRWVGLVGLPPFEKEVVSFTAADKGAARKEIARLIAINAVPADTIVRSKLEHDDLTRARLARESRRARNNRLGFRGR